MDYRSILWHNLGKKWSCWCWWWCWCWYWWWWWCWCWCACSYGNDVGNSHDGVGADRGHSHQVAGGENQKHSLLVLSFKSLKPYRLPLSVRKMRGLQYIGAGLQYIGAPEFYFQNSGTDWGGRALIKPGFVYHMMAQLMDWKPFVCRVSCSKIKQKTCLLNRRGSNKLEPRLQYNGAHAPIYWSPSNIFLTQ